MSDFRKKVEEDWESYKKDKSKELYPNILLMGISGAGKSSLINKIFRVNLAKISNIRPETRGFNFYNGKDYSMTVNLIDSAGYEMNQGKTYLKEINNILANGMRVSGEVEYIHVVWYCIPITNKRIEDIDIKMLKNFTTNTTARDKVCIVFTKCDEDTEDGEVANEFRRILEKECNYKFPSFETSTDPEFDEPLQLSELLNWSANAIDDDDLRKKFIGSQMHDLELKHREAKKIIVASTASAAGIGAVPIPFSYSVLLVPVQVTMIGKIIDTYGVSNLATLSDAVIVDLVVSQLGKSFVTKIIKLIPIAGQVVGSLIDASVASAITGGLGTAISEICYRSVEKYLKGESVMWDQIFVKSEIMDIMKNYMKK